MGHPEGRPTPQRIRSRPFRDLGTRVTASQDEPVISASSAERGPQRRDQPRPRSLPPASWLEENLLHSLPMLILGGTCLGLAFGLPSLSRATVGHLPLWALVGGVGMVFTGGGIALALVDDSEGGGRLPQGDQYILVRRADWEALAAATTPVRGAPAPTATRQLRSPAAGGARATPQSPAASPIASTPAVRFASPPAGPAPPPVSPAPAATPTPPLAPPRPIPAPLSAVSQPAVDEAAIDAELDSMLESLEPPPAVPALRRPAVEPIRHDVCASCGTDVASWEEVLGCVVCDRPLCAKCQDASFAESRPGLCPSCDAERRHGGDPRV